MENIFVAIIIIFILLFGGLTMSEALISAEQTVSEAQQESAARANHIARVTVIPVAIHILNSGSTMEIILRNTGTVKLADFNHWDVFTEYYDSSATPVYHSARLPYEAVSIPANTWSVGGIYLDWTQNVHESYDPGILDAGEELAMLLNVAPAVGVGQSAQVTIVTETGASASIIGKRNAPPTLAVNVGFSVALHGSVTLTSKVLLAQDADNAPSELIYNVVTAPAQGTLTPAAQFTQHQIDDGQVVYMHSGTDADSFTFTLSDGVDTIGPFTVPITINVAPVLAINTGLVLPASSTATITSSLLQVTDADNPANELTYTVTQFPANGTLSLGSTFTQADIDSNRLTYTHTATDADLFEFVVSDGYSVIGAYRFVITLVGQ